MSLGLCVIRFHIGVHICLLYICNLISFVQLFVHRFCVALQQVLHGWHWIYVGVDVFHAGIHKLDTGFYRQTTWPLHSIGL